MIHFIYGLIIVFILFVFYMFYIFSEKIHDDLKKELKREKEYTKELENKLMKFIKIK